MPIKRRPDQRAQKHPVSGIEKSRGMVFEYCRTRNLREVFESLRYFYQGMGKNFAAVVSLIVAGEIFANGLLRIGAVDALIGGAQNAGLGARPLILVMSLIKRGLRVHDGFGQRGVFFLCRTDAEDRRVFEGRHRDDLASHADHDELWPRGIAGTGRQAHGDPDGRFCVDQWYLHFYFLNRDHKHMKEEFG